MVQYFRNYIVRPAGSLSAASTVDSLSSSFICNINDANTLLPPPYSRAASPEIGFSPHFQQQYMMPRSASQLVCQNFNNSLLIGSDSGGVVTSNVQYELNKHLYNGHNRNFTPVKVNSTSERVNGVGNEREHKGMANYNVNIRDFVSEEPYNDGGGDDNNELTNDHVDDNAINTSSSPNNNSLKFVQSQSDENFRYITNSNSSISDIFVNNSCAAGIGGSSRLLQRSEDPSMTRSISNSAHGTHVIYSNDSIKINPLLRVNTNPTKLHIDPSDTREPVLFQSNNSIGGISITVPTGIEDSYIICSKNDIRDLQLVRRSLETCCQLLQQQQQKQPAESLAVGDSPLRRNDIAKKYIDESLLRSYMTSESWSGVSSLANIGPPSSPPRAISPTGEVREILDQIRQLQEGVSKYEEGLVIRSATRSMSSPSPVKKCTSPAIESSGGKLQRISTMPEHQTLVEAAANRNNNSISDYSVQSVTSTSSAVVETQTAKMTTSKSSLNSNFCTNAGFSFTSSSKRPLTLQHNKKRFYASKPPNKATYIPMMATNQLPSSSRCTILKSPVTSVVNSNFFLNRGHRQLKGWISKSAPTTPATQLPPSYMGDDSPLLLNEHDEDQEGEQNA